jgi:Cu/Ag efflux protein CusF
MTTTKRILGLAVAVLFVAVFAQGAIAAEKLSSFKGEIVSVDTKAKEVTVKAISTTTTSTTIVKGEMTFATDKKTKISAGKKSQKLKNLKTGDMVEVQYHSKGNKDIADSILVTPKPK